MISMVVVKHRYKIIFKYKYKRPSIIKYMKISIKGLGTYRGQPITGNIIINSKPFKSFSIPPGKTEEYPYRYLGKPREGEIEAVSVLGSFDFTIPSTFPFLFELSVYKVIPPPPPPAKPHEFCLVPEPSDEQMSSGHFYLKDKCGNWHEYLFTPHATNVMPWADKGYWSSGPKGELLGPITVAMAWDRLNIMGPSGYYEYSNDFPAKIARWYEENYPDEWGQF